MRLPLVEASWIVGPVHVNLEELDLTVGRRRRQGGAVRTEGSVTDGVSVIAYDQLAILNGVGVKYGARRVFSQDHINVPNFRQIAMGQNKESGRGAGRGNATLGVVG